MSEDGDVWIQGAGELASGVAFRLVRSGYRVVMAEIPHPLVVRRLVAFAEAVRQERIEVEGLWGRLGRPSAAGFTAGEVTVIVDPQAQQLPRLDPRAIVDARMTKTSPRPLPVGSRPVIGLGPGFCCGRDAVFVIETHRGARLGAVLERGEAASNTGIPGTIAGEGARRLLRAPAAGRLEPLRRIGDLVRTGETVATVGGRPVTSRLDGLVRGLIHPDVELFGGEKVGDIDPRGSAVDPRLVSDKALAIAGGVLEALLRLRVRPV
jgi:xanthine dehydrogenase accessory factor